MGTEQEIAEKEVVEEVVDDQVLETETEEVEETEQPEKEPWQLTEEEEGEPLVPVDSHIRMKQKLKGKISKRDEEIEKLRLEIESLKTGSSKPVTLPKRPRLEDYDSDEEHEAALEKWDKERLELLVKNNEATRTTKQQQERFQSKIAEEVDKHYDRTAKLVEKSGISPDIFKEADTSVRHAVDAILPGSGDKITDHIISLLGDGSEKVMYFIGRNKAAKAEFQSLLAEDKTGSKALVYLGQQKERLTNPKAKASTAPKPASNATGDANINQSGGALKKKYDAAHSKGSYQLAFDLKMQAKKSGVDVRSW